MSKSFGPRTFTASSFVANTHFFVAVCSVNRQPTPVFSLAFAMCYCSIPALVQVWAPAHQYPVRLVSIWSRIEYHARLVRVKQTALGRGYLHQLVSPRRAVPRQEPSP